ncbi:MAG TPA: glucokinase [Candidatus Methylomirabilis sp.]|nr:glucokinase [Candidatus Methylomirabilis sp.]
MAGDIGGTSTRLGLFELADGALRRQVTRHFPSREHRGLEEIVDRFRSAYPEPVGLACFGVAGPVVGGRAATPNLPWVVDGASLARELGLAGVDVINDLEANAHGIPALGPEDTAALNAGSPRARGNAAVISAGTGLGEAGLYWDGQRHHPFACEGGHADFSPTSDEEIDLLRHLRAKFGSHVSWERVVSGPGLANIYEFLRGRAEEPEPDWLHRELASGDAPTVISRAALDGRSALCSRALDLFVSAYGGEAGNLALKAMALRGVYVGGGIAPKILARLRAGAFMEAFANKGRLRPLLEAIPVRVITNDETALLGAARCAALRASLISQSAL